MGFREREKDRLAPLKPSLFSAGAARDGVYRGKRRAFCLHEDHAEENLHASLRGDALAYFDRAGVHWHDGLTSSDGRGTSSNHLCCSQAACVNLWMAYRRHPDQLARVMAGLGYPVGEMLPVVGDRAAPSEEQPYFVAFEWIGEKNYLGETSGGRIVSDDQRSRGRHFTSADFVLRFRQDDGKCHVVLGEWKYTERYPRGRSIQVSGSKTDRHTIYRAALNAPNCQIVGHAGVGPEDLYYDPFDQLMRLQLLASAMERHRGMGADLVSVLHVAPRANRDLMRRITSPALAPLGPDVHSVWAALVRPGRFRGAHVEDLLLLACGHAADPGWAEWMARRYGSMA